MTASSTSICVLTMSLLMCLVFASAKCSANETEQEQIKNCFSGFSTSDLLSQRLAFATPRCRMNGIASKIYGQIRRGHQQAVDDLLAKFKIHELTTPPAANKKMNARDLEKLRLDQWSFMKSLLKQLDTRQLQFADELDAIDKIPRRTQTLTDIRIAANGKEATAYTTPGTLRIKVHFIKDMDRWMFDGSSSPDQYELYPRGIQQRSDEFYNANR